MSLGLVRRNLFLEANGKVSKFLFKYNRNTPVTVHKFTREEDRLDGQKSNVSVVCPSCFWKQNKETFDRDHMQKSVAFYHLRQDAFTRESEKQMFQRLKIHHSLADTNVTVKVSVVLLVGLRPQFNTRATVNLQEQNGELNESWGVCGSWWVWQGSSALFLSSCFCDVLQQRA